MKIKGVCLHHDAGVLGASVPKEVWRRRLLNLKLIGVNAVRTSHNPQASMFYDLCDELGLLVLNEMFDEWEYPKRKWIEGWNIGTPGYEGSYDFFEKWGEKDLADFVRRDRNHLSVFACSIGNEVDYPNDPYSHPVLDGGKDTGFTQAIYGGYKKDAPDAMRLGVIAQRLAEVVKRYDRSRPTTAGLAGVAMSNRTAYPGALDIVGYNYTESLYETDHQTYPDRVIYGSENRHDYAAWMAVKKHDFIFGQFLWTGIDYLGESGAWPSRGFYSGLLDFGGFLKPRGYYRQSLWSDTPMAYLGTYPAPANISEVPSMDAWPIWNYDREGAQIRVVCYTNCVAARLLLNGAMVGTTKPKDEQCGILFWDIPYYPGRLEVEALDEQGTPVARYVLQTADAPSRIIAETDRVTVAPNDLIQVFVRVEDSDGHLAMLSDHELECRIDGPAILLGMEGSNNSDMTDYTDNRHRVYHGSMVVYLRAGSERGNVDVHFDSPGLESCILSLVIE